jgi:hypothetical protein
LNIPALWNVIEKVPGLPLLWSVPGTITSTFLGPAVLTASLLTTVWSSVSLLTQSTVSPTWIWIANGAKRSSPGIPTTVWWR